MNNFFNANRFDERLRLCVTAAWSILSKKVGNGLIQINKEASMQLQYAYILRHMLPLVYQAEGEHAELELETGVLISGKPYNIDILLKGKTPAGNYDVAIELKCYKEKSATDGKRGAQNIFMKDVYDDLGILERYVEQGKANSGVALIMTDYQNFVNPKKKSGIAWEHYDIANGTKISPTTKTTAIANKDVYIELKKHYEFDWQQFGNFYFAMLEGASNV
jgi:hypothetical protein